MRVGIVGWRGMVGSVLMQRMREEGILTSFEPVFFSTSQAGQAAPMGGGKLLEASDLKTLGTSDVIISCQGGDYTTATTPPCAPPAGRAIGSTRPRPCAWTTTRSSSSIPVNRNVIDRSPSAGVKDYIGGNCTVSLMLMALGGLFRAGPGGVALLHDLPGRFRRRRS